ncbi:MAG: InlB B-repeat-containing protein [Anaerocolumna sp.]
MNNKKVETLGIISALFVLILSGCGVGKVYTVSFEDSYNESSTYDSFTVSHGDKLRQPETPKREGYIFHGWYQDAERTIEWNFDKDKMKANQTLYALWDVDKKDEIEYPSDDKDFSSLKSPGSQENEYSYSTFFLPDVDGINQPYVGDPMPYYEDGIYYIYYLKDGGDSYNHSIYLTTTTDFVTYEEQDTPVLEASRTSEQDSWIGTGSVVKVGETNYLFYTGHTASVTAEFKEKIMVAKSDNLTSFNKVEGWEIAPPSELGQKNDFRDPQAYVDSETGNINLTVTASQNGIARILKYTLSSDLKTWKYDGIIFTNTEGDFWNLECSDTFRLGDTWYITYSAQDDTLWYASSDSQYGPYSEAKRLEGKLFYAAKHVEDGNNSYMVGWARRSESVSSTQDVAAWAGNLEVQKLVEKEKGVLSLSPVDTVVNQYQTRRALLIEEAHLYADAGSQYTYYDVFNCYESFVITGDFYYSGSGSFGLCFDYNGKNDKYKMISITPESNAIQLYFNEGSTLIAESEVNLDPGRNYSFTYIQEGSVGIFYIDGEAALTVRIYGASGKPIRLFVESNTVVFSSLRQYSK